MTNIETYGVAKKWEREKNEIRMTNSITYCNPHVESLKDIITIDAQRAVPRTSHEYRITAVQRLAEAFGFIKRTRTIGPNGQLVYRILECLHTERSAYKKDSRISLLFKSLKEKWIC